MESLNSIAQWGSEITMDELDKLYHQEIEDFNRDLAYQMDEIQRLIKRIMANIRSYNKWFESLNTINLSKDNKATIKLELKKNLIYDDFFRLQNLINAYINQKVIMTYVHVGPDGQREIRLFDNTIDNLMVSGGHSKSGRSYKKLVYDAKDHYLKLKNSLSKTNNQAIQDTAKQVTLRFEKYKGQILWKINASKWVGYKLYNRGPINEAFVDFYIKEYVLKGNLNSNIDIFMRSQNPQGVIQADNANGFLIGDTSLRGMQFAVKGEYGGPQGFKRIMKWLEDIVESGFSKEGLQNFIVRFTEEERQRATKLVKPMTQESIQTILNKQMEQELLSPLQKIIDGDISIDWSRT